MSATFTARSERVAVRRRATEHAGQPIIVRSAYRRDPHHIGGPAFAFTGKLAIAVTLALIIALVAVNFLRAVQ